MYPPLPLPQCCCKHCLRDDLMRKNQHCTGGGGGGIKKVYELISTIVATLLVVQSKAHEDIACEQAVPSPNGLLAG